MRFKGNKIQPLDAQTTQENTLVPRHPFTLQITAGKAGGKTTCILNLLINPNVYHKHFHRVIWISPTINLDEKIQRLFDYDVVGKNEPLLNLIIQEKLKNKNLSKSQIAALFHMFNEPTEPEFYEDPGNILGEVIEDQKKIIRKYGKKYADRVCIILDDLAGDRHFYNSPAMVKKIFNSRHVYISVIMTSQSYKSIPYKIRENNTSLFLFDTSDMARLKEIYAENTEKLTFNEFYALFMNIMNEDHAFLNFTCQNTMGHNLIRNIEEFIDYWPRKEAPRQLGQDHA